MSPGRSTATHATKHLASGHGIAAKRRMVACTVIHSFSIVIVIVSQCNSHNNSKAMTLLSSDAIEHSAGRHQNRCRTAYRSQQREPL